MKRLLYLVLTIVCWSLSFFLLEQLAHADVGGRPVTDPLKIGKIQLLPGSDFQFIGTTGVELFAISSTGGIPFIRGSITLTHPLFVPEIDANAGGALVVKAAAGQPLDFETSDGTVHASQGTTGLWIFSDNLQTNSLLRTNLGVLGNLGNAATWTISDLFGSEGITFHKSGQTDIVGGPLSMVNAKITNLAQATIGTDAVAAGRTVTGILGVGGGGDLTADRTLWLDTAFSPTWTGTHTFSNPLGANAVKTTAPDEFDYKDHLAGIFASVTEATSGTRTDTNICSESFAECESLVDLSTGLGQGQASLSTQVGDFTVGDSSAAATMEYTGTGIGRTFTLNAAGATLNVPDAVVSLAAADGQLVLDPGAGATVLAPSNKAVILQQGNGAPADIVEVKSHAGSTLSKFENDGSLTAPGVVYTAATRGGVATLDVSGNATATVVSGCRPQCTDGNTTTPSVVACSVASTTLTLKGTAADTVNWLCY